MVKNLRKAFERELKNRGYGDYEKRVEFVIETRNWKILTEEEFINICTDEVAYCAECKELEYMDNLTDTEGMYNGGIGYVCETCLECMR